MDKGWFVTPGRAGDRTLDQQMEGLDQVVAEVPGKTVLDFGSAEGLIAIELAKAGAAGVTAFEVLQRHVAVGRKIAAAQGVAVEFVVADLNAFEPAAEPADIVLLLAILHKLRDPSTFACKAASLAKELLVVRLPPAGPIIRDARSGLVEHDVGAVITSAGFALESTTSGTNGEWLGYYRRAGVVPVASGAPAAASPQVTEADGVSMTAVSGNEVTGDGTGVALPPVTSAPMPTLGAAPATIDETGVHGANVSIGESIPTGAPAPAEPESQTATKLSPPPRRAARQRDA